MRLRIKSRQSVGPWRRAAPPPPPPAPPPSPLLPGRLVKIYHSPLFSSSLDSLCIFLLISPNYKQTSDSECRWCENVSLHRHHRKFWAYSVKLTAGIQNGWTHAPLEAHWVGTKLKFSKMQKCKKTFNNLASHRHVSAHGLRQGIKSQWQLFHRVTRLFLFHQEKETTLAAAANQEGDWTAGLLSE